MFSSVELYSVFVQYAENGAAAMESACFPDVINRMTGIIEVDDCLLTLDTSLLCRRYRRHGEELSEDRDELLESDPFRKEAIPLYQVITNYLKENDVTFVNI